MDPPLVFRIGSILCHMHVRRRFVNSLAPACSSFAVTKSLLVRSLVGAQCWFNVILVNCLALYVQLSERKLLNVSISDYDPRGIARLIIDIIDIDNVGSPGMNLITWRSL
jgi:hypothetical protein